MTDPADRSARYRELLGLEPQDTPLAPRTEERFDRDGLAVERVSFSVGQGDRAVGLFVRPAGSTGKLPAVSALHCHGGFFAFGKEKLIATPDEPESVVNYKEELYGGRSFGTELARRGYAVLSIDAFYFGERRRDDLVAEEAWRAIEAAGGARAVDGAGLLNSKLGQAENEQQREFLAKGRVWPGKILADDIRSIDYLLTRPEVDPDRIGCIGLSLGGFRGALLSGMDTRVRAAVVAGWMCDLGEMDRAHRNSHTWMVYVPRLAACGDLTGLTALHAPNPLLVVQCQRDTLFALEGMRAACERLAGAYAACRAADAFESRFYDVPHQFDVRMQEDSFDWLDRVL